MCEAKLDEIGEEKAACMPLTEVDFHRRHVTVTKRVVQQPSHAQRR